MIALIIYSVGETFQAEQLLHNTISRFVLSSPNTNEKTNLLNATLNLSFIFVANYFFFDYYSYVTVLI